MNDPQSMPPAAAAVASAPDGLAIVTCWKERGVEGDGSCPRLGEIVHCHNCPSYAEAGLRLLDRQPPAAYRAEWTAYFAGSPGHPAGPRTSVVVFRVGLEWFSLPTAVFQEIAERRTVHSIPHRRRGILLGIVNVRGELLLCISLSRLLGIGDGPATERRQQFYDRLMVVAWEGRRLALPADEVHGTCRFHPDDLRPPPSTIARGALTFTGGMFAWQGRMVGVINPDLLFAALSRNLS